MSQRLDLGTAASLILEKTNKLEAIYFAGDPATTFHEIRRFLFTQGVDSMLYTASKPPPGFSEGGVIVSSPGIMCVENAFFSDFRTMVAVESAPKRTVLNTLVFTIRVIINGSGDGNDGLMQIVLNHLHDGIAELNGIYGNLCGFLSENGWEHHGVSDTSCKISNFSLTSNMVYEKRFTCVHDFTSMYYKLKTVLERNGVVGSNLQIERPY